MNNETVPVSVKILDKEYRIACAPKHKESLEESANLLNNKMLEIRASGKVIGSDRIAVMAALNLAHDLLQQEQQTADTTQIKQQIMQIRKKIDTTVNAGKQMEMS
jgi:cell division protein ZapA